MQDEAHMQPYYGNAPPPWWGVQPPPPSPPRRGGARRWLLIGGLALAFVFTLGVGAALGSPLLQTALAASGQPNSGTTFGPLAATTQAPGRGGPGGQGQCSNLTVSSVSGNTITAKAQDGSTVTIHTTSSTQYTRAGASASASDVKAGSVIHVDGTHNSDGSITATHIDIS